LAERLSGPDGGPEEAFRIFCPNDAVSDVVGGEHNDGEDDAYRDYYSDEAEQLYDDHEDNENSENYFDAAGMLIDHDDDTDTEICNPAHHCDINDNVDNDGLAKFTPGESLYSPTSSGIVTAATIITERDTVGNLTAPALDQAKSCRYDGSSGLVNPATRRAGTILQVNSLHPPGSDSDVCPELDDIYSVTNSGNGSPAHQHSGKA
jgi:hypothetical protein